MKNNSLESILENIKKQIPNNDNYTRLGTTFSTRAKKYFFDTGTGKVFECNKNEFLVLEHILEKNIFPDTEQIFLSKNDLVEAYQTIETLMINEHILQSPMFTKFYRESTDLQAKILDRNIQQIIIELTEQCNLRCKYCIYNEHNPEYRNFEAKDMTWEIAKKAIDYYNNHSTDKMAVTFYGGEPLVNFKLMKRCIEYSEKIVKDKELTFSFSTNLVLMTPEIASYIANSKCTVLVSIDGPKEMHDAYRINSRGEGSFDKAIQGLKHLVNAMGAEAKDRILINSVVCPPYSKKKLDKVQKFFDSLDWLPAVDKKCGYVEPGSLRAEDIEKSDGQEYSLLDMDSISAWSLNNILADNDKKGYATGLKRTTLSKIHSRMLIDKPNTIIRRNGCCSPGQRRIYIRVNGTFELCEKLGNSPDIGNVYDGIDIEKIKKYYFDDYEEKSFDRCQDCWAIHLCGICYAECYSEDGLNIDKKESMCISQRMLNIGQLIQYYQLLEEKPEVINEIKDIELT